MIDAFDYVKIKIPVCPKQPTKTSPKLTDTLQEQIINMYHKQRTDIPDIYLTQEQNLRGKWGKDKKDFLTGNAGTT